MAGNSHLVLYDNSSGFVHAVWKITTVGPWSNSTTYLSDGKITTGTAGDVAVGLGANMRCVALNNPTFDDADYAGFGALKVNSTTSPTDTQERTDGDRIRATGGRDGDLPDYTFTA